MLGANGLVVENCPQCRLKNFRQIRAASGATVGPVACPLYRAVCGQFIQPIHNIPIAATLRNQALYAIAPITPAPVARHPQGIELADEVAEDDGAVMGHLDLK